MLDTRITQPPPPSSPCLQTTSSLDRISSHWTLQYKISFNIDWNYLLLLLHLLNKTKNIKRKCAAFFLCFPPHSSISRQSLTVYHCDPGKTGLQSINVIFYTVVWCVCLVLCLKPSVLLTARICQRRILWGMCYMMSSPILWIGDWSCTIDQLDNRGQIYDYRDWILFVKNKKCDKTLVIKHTHAHTYTQVEQHILMFR